MAEVTASRLMMIWCQSATQCRRGVVATPDAVWHRDSHYWRKVIWGVHKIQIFVRELVEEFDEISSAKKSGGSGN